jgi:hypothetical protein
MTTEQRIFMENEYIKLHKELEPKLKAYFKNYIGTKIKNADGTLIKKIKSDLEYQKLIDRNAYKITPLSGGFASLNLYVVLDTYSIRAGLQLCFNGGAYENKTYYCEYVDRSIYIGKLDGGILAELHDQDNMTELNPEEQISLINLYNTKAGELREISDKIHYSLRGFQRGV